MNEEILSPNENPICCKTILVGDSGVGKTSIIGRYIRKYKEESKITITASFTNKLEKIDDKHIYFEIWDTAGTERYRSMNNIFYKDSSICIMVYDITEKESFDNLKNYWHKEIINSSSSPKIIFHVAGNKIDLYENEKVKEEDVKKYCDNIGCEYSLISAKDNTNIDDLFKKLGEKFLNSDIYKDIKNNNNKRNNFAVDIDEKSEKKGGKCC